MAPRVAPLGWHLVFQFEGSELAERAPRLAKLACDVVIDHIGRFVAPIALENENVRALFDLVDGGRCWVKLSAPYQLSKTGAPDYSDYLSQGCAFVKAAPERMVWGTNWPHPRVDQKPDEADLLDVLLDWTDGDEKTIHAILVENPATLYGF